MDDNELISPGEFGHELKNNNGECYVEDKVFDEMPVSTSDNLVSGIGGSSSSLSFPVGNKRQGLKKWRRIPRELARRSGSRLINDKENGDSTVSPVHEAMMNVNGAAASDPSMRNEISNLNGDNSVSVLLPDDDQRNGRMGPGKKARGFETEKENSNSSSIVGIMGSDSGRSNFVFVQGGNSVGGKGRVGSAFAKHDEESSDDKDLSEKAQLGFVKSDAESDDFSLAADNIEKHEGSVEHDPLVESIKGLHSVQEEFGKEVQKWKDVGKDDRSIFNDPIHEILELKDARIKELEQALSSVGIKTDLEDRLMKIIQADVENVVISTTTKQLTEGPLRETKCNLKQKNVASQRVQATDVTLEMKENLKKLKHRVCRFTSCFMIQLILLLVTLYLKSTPQDAEVVPT